MVKDGDIALQEDTAEEPPEMVKEPREKIKFKSLERPTASEAPEAKKTKKDKKDDKTDKDKASQEKDEDKEIKTDSKSETEEETDTSTSESKSSSSKQSKSPKSRPKTKKSKETDHLKDKDGSALKPPKAGKQDSKLKENDVKDKGSTKKKTQKDAKVAGTDSNDDTLDDLNFEDMDEDQLAELLETDTVVPVESEVTHKKPKTKDKQKKKTKPQKKPKGNTEEDLDIDKDIDFTELSADMQAELAEMLDLELDS